MSPCVIPRLHCKPLILIESHIVLAWLGCGIVTNQTSDLKHNISYLVHNCVIPRLHCKALILIECYIVLAWLWQSDQRDQWPRPWHADYAIKNSYTLVPWISYTVCSETPAHCIKNSYTVNYITLLHIVHSYAYTLYDNTEYFIVFHVTRHWLCSVHYKV